MAVPNEVKFKVRHYALLLEEFTVSQIVELTGLKGTSVRTEIQRMKREELVTSSRQKGQGRGGPPCVYRLTDDPEARLALSRSIEAFYTEIAPRPVEPRRPASRHFFQAVELIRDLVDQKVEASERDAAIEEAAYHLEFARREEGVGREGTEVVGAYLDREKAKLEAIRGNITEAQRLFRQSIVAFKAADLHAEVERVQADLLCSLLQRWIKAARRNEALTWLRTVELLQESVTETYEEDLQACSLAGLLKDLFDLLLEKGRVDQLDARILDRLGKMIADAHRQTTEKVKEAIESERHKAAFDKYIVERQLQSETLIPSFSEGFFHERKVKTWDDYDQR